MLFNGVNDTISIVLLKTIPSWSKRKRKKKWKKKREKESETEGESDNDYMKKFGLLYLLKGKGHNKDEEKLIYIQEFFKETVYTFFLNNGFFIYCVHDFKRLLYRMFVN